MCRFAGLRCPSEVLNLKWSDINWEQGRFIATADSSLPFHEVSDCPIIEWLSDGAVDPNILIFGWGSSDGPGGWPVGANVTQSIHLPAQYIGNAAALKADYDIVDSIGEFGPEHGACCRDVGSIRRRAIPRS